MRGSASSLDRPSTLPITRFREGHSPPFHDVLVSCLVLSSISAWVLRCYGWKVGSSLVFGVLIVVLANLEVTLINGQLWTLKGAPLVRFSPFPSILISSSLRLNTTTHPTSPYTLTVMSQQTHAFPYQRPVFHPRPVPFPPPYQRVANHSYGLRPRVAPIRGYGPVPRPSPVHPAANVPARQSGFVQRPLTPMPVTGNGPFLSSSARRPGSNQRAVASTPVIRNVPFLSDTVSNSFRFGGRPGPVLTANIRDPRLLMGNQTALRANSANPYLFPPPSPIFDRTLRSPTPFPPSSVWAEFFRNTVSSQGSSSGHRRMDLDIPLVDRIGPPASSSSNASLRANAAAFVPPAAPRPRRMSTPPSSPRGPPGYVPSPSAANWGRCRGSESSTVGQPSSRRSSTSAASLPESEEVVVYHSLSVDQIHMLLEQPEGVNPYDRHLFSNRVPKDKYRFTAVGFAKLCHAFPTTSQAERDARVAFFESLVYLRRPDAATVN
ncbi:hypothetical protein Pst134EA_011614 [Puccinia striiformis f. sp. tritici]|uniref:hypothetical protein n=1 Tax=Puccinia striiformis f. sp. tritici TaxID=168172 RepID=UPI0020080F11|nr:hypothetical protein Pst134EA_011614 [Puccinia striiformis f. sp. tritici]KAH9467992.1 hypothetical protein Pst134EA_011614 [Puccinia striiformis f. sp. tritici]